MTDRFTPTAAGNGASVSVLDGDALDGVLFDRDGTPVVDVPYNSDPDAVVPMPTARAALALLRRHGLRTGVGRRVNARVVGAAHAAGARAVLSR